MSAFLAEFTEPAALVAAIDRLRQDGFRPLDSYTPHPVPELDERFDARPSRLPLVILLAGVAGALGGFGMEVYAATIDYPINIGGRPYNSWPAFVPIAFEIGVLAAVAAGFLGYLIANRLPRLEEPEGDLFRTASRDGYVLAVATDDSPALRHALADLGAVRVAEIVS